MHTRQWLVRTKKRIELKFSSDMSKTNREER